MKREIKIVDAENNIIQYTFEDERWYLVDGKYLPSVSWIASYYPKGIEFQKWLANEGWEGADAKKRTAGEKGSRVHKAIEHLIKGNKITHDAKFSANGEPEQEITAEEYGAIISFARWAEAERPRFLLTETTVCSKKYGYAGTVDAVAMIGDEVYILDWKTSKNIYPSMEIQIAAYREAFREMGYEWAEMAKIAILQVGYDRNKAGYKFTEIPLNGTFETFLATRNIWEREAREKQPKQRDYPSEVELGYIAKNK